MFEVSKIKKSIKVGYKPFLRCLCLKSRCLQIGISIAGHMETDREKRRRRGRGKKKDT
jgi:hypothetical protein